MNKGKYSIIMAIMSLIMYPINDIICVGLMVVAVSYAILAVKDKEVITKVAQPALMIMFLYTLRAVLAVIVGIINNIVMLSENYYSSQLYQNITNYNRVQSIIFMFLILIFTVTVIICFALNKDIPLVGNISRKIIGEKKDNCQ